ncbi:MAG: insulinase family protein [Sedimentisphaerales bacterium]|nr:insulinase family protein [Sedimentisphaerales bacterium]
MTEKFDKHILKNGMVIIGEPMEAVNSVAFDFMLPAGASVLPQGCCGAANVIADWIFRGAGSRNSRQLSDALDSLGIHRAESVGSSNITIGAVLEADNLAPALDLYADIILRPRLEEDQFEPAKQLAIDEVRSLNDEPRQKVMLKVQELFYPSPLGRSTVGDIDELAGLSAEKTQEIVKSNFNPSQTIFSIAGKYDFDAVCRKIEDEFEYRISNTESRNSTFDIRHSLPLGPRAGGYTHIDNDSAQVHIGLMTETVRPDDDEYYNARMAVSVLSGGMSARLFTEVREKRGLCYSVGARYHGLKQAAGVMCYAGTTPDKVQQTLDCIIGEFNRLRDGISQEEIERAKAGLKSILVLLSESSSSRAGAIGSDYYILGRLRCLDEIKDKIDATTVDSILCFLRANIFKDFTVMTIGPKDIQRSEFNI